MRKKNPKLSKKIIPADTPDPPWLHDNPDAIPIPYTKEELDELVKGFIAGNSDSKAWKDLVIKVGIDEAKQILRKSFINKDPNIINRSIIV